MKIFYILLAHNRPEQFEPVPYANLFEGGMKRVRDTYFHLGGRLVQRVQRLKFNKENAGTFYKILRYRPSQIFGTVRAFFVRRRYPFPDRHPEMLFARKFDDSTAQGKAILDYLDNRNTES